MSAKLQLMDSSDEEDLSDYSEIETEFEKKARKREQKDALRAADSEAELKTNIGQSEKFVLPSGQEIEHESTTRVVVEIYLTNCSASSSRYCFEPQSHSGDFGCFVRLH